MLRAFYLREYFMSGKLDKMRLIRIKIRKDFIYTHCALSSCKQIFLARKFKLDVT